MRNYAIIVVLLTIALTASGYPQPSLAAKPGIWTLDTQVLQPQQIIIDVPGKGPQRFWYTILTLTNTGFDDARCFLNCEIMTDTFKVTLAKDDGFGRAFKRIKRIYQGKYPFLESLDEFDHRVLVGSDNARDIAVIWQDFDSKAKNVKIFISGLSNEIIKVYPPISDDSSVPEPILLRKTLELDYSMAGDPARRSEAGLVFNSKSWVMR